MVCIFVHIIYSLYFCNTHAQSDSRDLIYSAMLRSSGLVHERCAGLVLMLLTASRALHAVVDPEEIQKGRHVPVPLKLTKILQK